MAAGLQYQVKTSATNTQTRELWYVKDPNAIGLDGTVDCLAANQLIYHGNDTVFPYRQWIKTFGSGTSANWGPCPNAYRPNNGIAGTVILRAAVT